MVFVFRCATTQMDEQSIDCTSICRGILLALVISFYLRILLVGITETTINNRIYKEKNLLIISFNQNFSRSKLLNHPVF